VVFFVTSKFGHDEHKVDTKDTTLIANKSSTKKFEPRPVGTAKSFEESTLFFLS